MSVSLQFLLSSALPSMESSHIFPWGFIVETSLPSYFPFLGCLTAQVITCSLFHPFTVFSMNAGSCEFPEAFQEGEGLSSCLQRSELAILLLLLKLESSAGTKFYV